MAKKIIKKVKVSAPAGKATPAPPLGPFDIVATCDDCGFEDRRPAEARVVAPDGWDTRYEGMGSLRRLRCSECVSAIRAASGVIGRSPLSLRPLSPLRCPRAWPAIARRTSNNGSARRSASRRGAGTPPGLVALPARRSARGAPGVPP